MTQTPGTAGRSNSTVIPEDYNLSVRSTFLPPRFSDTTQANSNTKLDTSGRLIYTYSSNQFWMRQCCPKRWVTIGNSVGDSTYTKFQVDSIVYGVATRIALGPSLLSTPVLDGIDPYTGAEVYKDSIHLVGDINVVPVNYYYGTNGFGILGYHHTRDFGYIDNILTEDRSVDLDGYSFAFEGSASTTTFLPDGSIQVGDVAKFLPSSSPTNELDLVESAYDTIGANFRVRSLKFYGVSDQGGGVFISQKNNTGEISSPQGDMLKIKSPILLLEIPITAYTVTQPKINLGAGFPLEYFGSGNGNLPTILRLHNNDSAQVTPLGQNGVAITFAANRQQSTVKTDFAKIAMRVTDTLENNADGQIEMWTLQNGTLRRQLIIDSIPSVATQDSALVPVRDASGTVRIAIAKVSGSGGGGSALTNVGSAYRLLKPGDQTMKTLSATGPLAWDSATSNQLNISIVDAAADGSTKGAASFTAADFNASSGNISIDYTNAQAASGSLKGFLTSADWTTFNNKQATISETDNNLTFSSNVIGTNKAIQNLTDGATITWNVANGYNARVVLGGNRTLAITNPQEGDYYTITFVQDGTGSRTITLPGGGSPSLNSSANDSTTIVGYYRNSAYEWRNAPSLISFTATDGNGFDFSVANSTTTPTLTATTTVSNTQVMFSNSGAIAGSSSMTWSGTRLSPNYITLAAGTASAGTAPLIFASGTSLTSAVAGAMEYTTDDLFFTISTGTARKRILLSEPVGGLTSGRVPFVTTNGRLTDANTLLSDGTNLGIGGSPGSSYNLSVTGSTATLAGARVLSTIVPGASGDGYGFYASPSMTEQGSGTHTIFASMRVAAPNVNAGAATLTRTAAIYLSDNSNGSVTDNNYAIYSVLSGPARFNGNLELNTIGNKIIIATGGSAESVGTTTLVSGTKTVNTTAVTASSLIFVVYDTPSGTLASGLSAPTASIVAGTSFVINSLTTSGTVNTSDNSTVRYWIIN